MQNQFTWLRAMPPRDNKESHRAATPLELLFDLVFVVAIAAAGQQLHHGIIENHLSHIIAPYSLVFFSLWWAWMNFTWFASAYDNDDVAYRLLTFVQIVGSLLIAVGIPLVFEEHNLWLITIGYVVMRCALLFQWLRAWYYDVQRRNTISIYIVGLLLVQIGWIANACLQNTLTWYFIAALVIAELSVPYFAEKQEQTTWHPHHIVEPYSLLTIIVLGESIIGGFNALVTAGHSQKFSNELIFLMIGSVMLMFAMWWTYFDRETHTLLNRQKHPFLWGYGHYFIFISIASVGAALAAAVDVITGKAEISNQYISCIIAFSLIIYSTVLWLLHDLPFLTGFQRWLYPISTCIVLCIPFLTSNVGTGVLYMALLYALRLIVSKLIERA